MEADLFTFTAFVGLNPVYREQGFPSYTSTTRFKCFCKESHIVLPHSAIATRAVLWACPMPRCGREYTLRVEYPLHVDRPDESIAVKLDDIEQSIESIERSLRQQQNLSEFVRRPVVDALIRPEDSIDAIERALRQPNNDLRLRQQLSDAFTYIGDRIWNLEQSLDGMNDRVEDAIRKAEETLRHVKIVEQTTAGIRGRVRGLQSDIGDIGHLENMIQRINPDGGFAQLEPILQNISYNLQRLQGGAVDNEALRNTYDAVRRIGEQLTRYNKRYDKSIGVIIG